MENIFAGHILFVELNVVIQLLERSIIWLTRLVTLHLFVMSDTLISIHSKCFFVQRFIDYQPSPTSSFLPGVTYLLLLLLLPFPIVWLK